MRIDGNLLNQRPVIGENNVQNAKNFYLPKMRHVEYIHFVGIGGAGMCGIAEVLASEGYIVTGSDIASNRATQHLEILGIKIFIGHHVANISNADVIVRSTAIHDDNVEIIAAQQQAIPIIPRAMMLAELMRFRYGIAVAGTHGKTTTTSLVSSLLAAGGLDPSFVIGGKLNNCDANAQLGKSSYFVVEADESDASFLFLKPMMAIVTNIDYDHMETYANSFEKLSKTFIEFLHHLPFYGLAILCIEDAEILRILPLIQRPIVTYGFNNDAHYYASHWSQQGMVSNFTVHRPNQAQPLSIKLHSPGRHNVLNALAAIAIATELGINDRNIVEGLAQFQGVSRRFQILGDKQFSHGIATVVDDYGHHPREIFSTIEALRAVWPDKKLIHVFQPHRYTRTQSLFNQFVDVLKLSDTLLLFDIYSAGEQEIPGITSESLLISIQAQRSNAKLVNKNNLLTILNTIITDGCIVLMQGAGNIGQLSQDIMITYE